MSVRFRSQDEDGVPGGFISVTDDAVKKVDALTYDLYDATVPGGSDETIQVPVVDTGDAVYDRNSRGLYVNTDTAVDSSESFSIIRPPWNVPWGLVAMFYYRTPAGTKAEWAFTGSSPGSGEPSIHTGSKGDIGWSGGIVNYMQHWAVANRALQITATVGDIRQTSGTPTGVRLKLRRHVSTTNAAFTPSFGSSADAGSMIVNVGADPDDGRTGVTLTSLDVLDTSAWVKYSLHAATTTGGVALHGPIHIVVNDIGPVTENIASMFPSNGDLVDP